MRLGATNEVDSELVPKPAESSRPGEIRAPEPQAAPPSVPRGTRREAVPATAPASGAALGGPMQFETLFAPAKEKPVLAALIGSIVLSRRDERGL